MSAETLLRLRRRQHVERICALNITRVWLEFVDELARHYPEIAQPDRQAFRRRRALRDVGLLAASARGSCRRSAASDQKAGAIALAALVL
jgi:hypothetical protein